MTVSVPNSILVIVVTLVALGVAQFSKQYAGPYMLVMRQLDDCQDSGINAIKVVSSKLNKVRRNAFSFSSEIVLRYGFSDDFIAGINLANFGNGGWKKNFYMGEFKKACSTFGTYMPKTFAKVVSSMGFKNCPIPPGNYTIKNLMIKEPKIENIPFIPYNKYRLEVYYISNQTKLGCKAIYFDSVPSKT